MGLREISLANKQRVVITALDYFIEKGIEKSRVRDIAEDSGLTERSVFRYYKNKAELVLDALMYLWNSRIGEISNYFDSLEVEGLSGKERCLKILIAYVDLFIVIVLMLCWVFYKRWQQKFTALVKLIKESVLLVFAKC